MSKPKYIISSGWWCNESENDGREKFLGSPEIRGHQFHKLWYKTISDFSSPSKILIVDSCSPIKPIIDENDERLELISLNSNAGHSTSMVGKYCGYTRAILVAMEYAMQCDTDYFVYVEQDVLLYGESIIEKCIDEMITDYMFGEAKNSPGKLQQSLFIIKQSAIRTFIKRLHAIHYSDKELNPEDKFSIAASRGWVPLLTYVAVAKRKSNVMRWLDYQLTKYLGNWCKLPIGFGRDRPINFNNEFFYFQHGSEIEIERLLKKQGRK